MKITALQVNCDNPECDYSSNVEQDEITEWINRPCPLCNANLFTWADFIKTCEMIELAGDLQSLNESLGVPTHDDEGEPIKLTMSCDRKGHVTITDKQPT